MTVYVAERNSRELAERKSHCFCRTCFGLAQSPVAVLRVHPIHPPPDPNLPLPRCTGIWRATLKENESRNTTRHFPVSEQVNLAMHPLNTRPAVWALVHYSTAKSEGRPLEEQYRLFALSKATFVVVGLRTLPTTQASTNKFGTASASVLASLP